MAIDSYDTLVAAIVDRMNDAAMESYAPEFIQLAEASFNRRLNTLDMEGSATITADASIPVPSDYNGAMSLRIDDYAPLAQLSADDFQTKWAEANPGRPMNFGIFGGQINLGPAPDTTYTVTMTYLRRLTPLTATATTNWLLEQNPDLYLYASLVEAETRGWNNEQAVMMNSKVEGILAEINMNDARRRRGNLTDTVEGIYF
ncbi:hypothetical protein TomTYG75_07150 [Sphingobium sp. TomTYG75]